MIKLLLALLLIPNILFAAGADDFRISDNSGNVLNINSDGSLPITLTGGGGGYFVQSPGNVGIGTTQNVGIGSMSPTQALDVVGNITTTGYIQSTGTGDSYFSGQNVGVGTNATVYSQLAISPPTSVIALSIGSTYATTSYPGITNASIFQSNVGIGTFSPAALLQVGATKLNVLSGGNIGIGSATPGVTLDIQGTVRASSFTAGQTLCAKADKSIGQCTSIVGAGGGCTCS